MKLPGYYCLLVNEERILGFDLKMDDEDSKSDRKMSFSHKASSIELVIRKPGKKRAKSGDNMIISPTNLSILNKQISKSGADSANDDMLNITERNNQ